NLWDATSGEHRAALHAPSYWIDNVVFSPDGKRLVSAAAGSPEPLLLWDVDPRPLTRVLRGHKGTLSSGVFSPDGRLLATGGFDSGEQRDRGPGEIRFWDVPSGQGRSLRIKTSRLVWALSFSSDGKSLAAAVDSGNVLVWDAASGKPKAALPAPNIRPLAFSP